MIYAKKFKKQTKSPAMWIYFNQGNINHSLLSYYLYAQNSETHGERVVTVSPLHLPKPE